MGSISQWLYASTLNAVSDGIAGPDLSLDASQHAFLDQSAVSAIGNSSTSASASASSIVADPLLSILRKHSSKGLPRWVSSACHDYEGWGPLSWHRDLGFTPCFLEAILIAAPAVLLALVGEW